MDKQRFQSEVFSQKDLMFRIALRMLSDADDANDAVQQTMMKMWQMKDELNNVNQVSAFVIRSLKNDCLNRIKRKQTIQFHHQQIGKSQTNFTKSSTSNLVELVKKEINKLPEKQKLIIHLRDVEGFEVKEIATMIEIDENAVRVNLTRARQKVKEQMQKIKEYDARQI